MKELKLKLAEGFAFGFGFVIGSMLCRTIVEAILIISHGMVEGTAKALGLG